MKAKTTILTMAMALAMTAGLPLAATADDAEQDQAYERWENDDFFSHSIADCPYCSDGLSAEQWNAEYRREERLERRNRVRIERSDRYRERREVRDEIRDDIRREVHEHVDREVRRHRHRNEIRHGNVRIHGSDDFFLFSIPADIIRGTGHLAKGIAGGAVDTSHGLVETPIDIAAGVLKVPGAVVHTAADVTAGTVEVAGKTAVGIVKLPFKILGSIF